MVVKDVKAVEKIPASLYRPLSEKLVSVILGSENIDAVPKATTKKIIYLWRIDELASSKGIDILLNAGAVIDFLETVRILNDLGLQELTQYVRMICPLIVSSRGRG